MRIFLFSCAIAGLCLGIVGCAPLHTPARVAGVGDGGSGANPIETYKQKMLREAMQGLRYASGRVEIDPETANKVARRGTAKDAQALVGKAQKQLSLNDNLEGIRSATKAVITSPELPDAYVILGKALITKGRIAESGMAFEMARALRDGDANTHFELGMYFHRIADLDRSVLEFLRTVELDPKHKEAHARLAVAYYYQQNYSEAWRWITRSEKIGADVPPQLKTLLAAQMPDPRG